MSMYIAYNIQCIMYIQYSLSLSSDVLCSRVAQYYRVNILKYIQASCTRTYLHHYNILSQLEAALSVEESTSRCWISSTFEKPVRL